MLTYLFILLFLAWGTIVGIVLGTFWGEVLKETRMRSWSYDDESIIYWTVIVGSTALAAAGGGLGYSYYGFILGAISPVLWVLAAVIVVELFWKWLPALWSFGGTTINRAAAAYISAVESYQRLRNDPARR